MSSLKVLFTDNDVLFIEGAQSLDSGSERILQARDDNGEVYTIPTGSVKYMIYTP